MSTPTELVEANGETVKLFRPYLVSQGYGEREVFYENAVSLKAIVSKPSDTSDMDKEGLRNVGDLTMTIPKNVEVSENRNGKPDVFLRGDKIYTVSEVMRDKHPLMDIEKKTITLEEFDGSLELVSSVEDSIYGSTIYGGTVYGGSDKKPRALYY